MEICGNMWKFIDDLYMNIIYEVNMSDLCVVSVPFIFPIKIQPL